MTATASSTQLSQHCLQRWEIFLINVGSVDETKAFCVYLAFLKIPGCADGIAVTQRRTSLLALIDQSQSVGKDANALETEGDPRLSVGNKDITEAQLGFSGTPTAICTPLAEVAFT